MSECNSKQLPKVQEQIQVKIPATKAADPVTVDGQIGVPFYYASISSFWIYMEADPKVLRRLLKGTGFRPFVHDKKGLVNFNFQNYSAHNGSPPVASTDEFEFNVIAYPESRKDEVPKMTHQCFMKGEDQTKLLGNYRLHVPCNSRFAIAAGKALFGERKFFGNFNYSVPSPNAPNNLTWKYKINDEKGKLIIDVNADFQSVASEVANPSAIIDYSNLPEGKDKVLRPIGSRRNIFLVAQHYNLSRTEAKKIRIKVGTSQAGPDIGTVMTEDLNAVLKGAKIIATQVIQTPPVIAESRAYNL